MGVGDVKSAVGNGRGADVDEKLMLAGSSFQASWNETELLKLDVDGATGDSEMHGQEAGNEATCPRVAAEAPRSCAVTWSACLGSAPVCLSGFIFPRRVLVARRRRCAGVVRHVRIAFNHWATRWMVLVQTDSIQLLRPVPSGAPKA